MTRNQSATYAFQYGYGTGSTTVERMPRKSPTEGYTPKGRKLNKTQRGGGVKGAFRNCEGKDSIVNQEKYFVGV